jgi:uncharacterized protein (DUF885 family)
MLMLTRRAALATTAAAALTACATPAAPKPAAPGPAVNRDEALNAKLEAIFDERLVRSPQFATSLGDRRGYDRWDERTEARAADDLALTKTRAAEARAEFGKAALGPQAQLSYELLQRQAQRAEAAYPWRRYGYRFNQMFGAQSQTPTFLINQHRVTNLDDAKAYIARLQGLKTYIGQIVAESEASVKAGITPPQFVFGYVLPAARNVIKGAPFEPGADSPLWADGKAKINRLNTDDAQKAALLAQAEAALKDSVAPAYGAMIAALEAQQPKARTTDGVWALPQGDAYYAWALKAQTTTEMSADEIHRTGLEAVARLHDETRQIMAKVGFKGDLKAFFDFMESDPRFYEPQTAEGKAGYIAKATAAIEAMKKRCPDYFNLMPKAPMEVRAVEAFREKSAGLAFYERPAADGSRPGVYYANTSNMKALPLYQLEALAYHEGIPGHHFQIAIAQELQGIPRFRRFGGGFTAYSEGWALYTEKLAKEMGFYTDPYSDFGRIVLELRRAIRLVVDTGLHAKKWPRQQAIQYILDNQPGDEAQARLDIDRYIVMPGQATAYLIGQMKILELRDKAKAAMGARFSIKGYHDVVLGNGAVPLDLLSDLVMAWTKA